MDVLKDLISQALRLNLRLHTEKAIALRCQTFRSAETESDWFQLFESVLAGLPQICVLLELDKISSYYAGGLRESSWPEQFFKIFKAFSDRGIRTLVKVILISYGIVEISLDETGKLQDSVIPVRRATTAQSRRGGHSRWSRRGKLSLQDLVCRGGRVFSTRNQSIKGWMMAAGSFAGVPELNLT